MKSNLKRWYFALATVSLVVSLVVASLSQVHAGNSNPKVIPPNAEPFGMSYGEWSARWWQWAFSLPVNKNPFYDQEGKCDNGANGQLGPVWFLTGALQSGTFERRCTVPAGKALLFPLINAECSTLEGNGNTEAELRECVKGYDLRQASVFAKIDGVKVQSDHRYLVDSPLFTVMVPPNNWLMIDCGTGESVANGYYLMLAPLSAGIHKIEFGGSVPGFSLKIKYILTVVPERR